MATIDRAATGKPVAARHEPASLATALRRCAAFLRRNEPHLWTWGGRTAALVPLVALTLTVLVLTLKAWPAIKVNGAHFLVGSDWKPGNTYGATVHTDGVAHPLGSSYGAWPLIAGTLQSSVIAIVIAVPVSVGTAFALTERIPRWLAEILRSAIEILAGVPSVLIGLWGALTLGPLLANDVSPIIASTTRNLFAQVPPLPKEGGEALGMTDWEVGRRITIPWVRSGIIGATMLGLGRALGETIAVAMVSGSLLNTIAPNIYGTMGTIAAALVTQLDSAFTDGTGFEVRTLAELAVVLVGVLLVVNMLGRLIIRRTGHLDAPAGQGY